MLFNLLFTNKCESTVKTINGHCKTSVVYESFPMPFVFGILMDVIYQNQTVIMELVPI